MSGLEKPVLSLPPNPSLGVRKPLSGIATVVAVVAASCLGACAPEEYKAPDNAILIGVALPFTGREAAVGRNFEQAMLLAAEDVNRAGGVDGRPIEIVSTDSNSGSERGFNNLLDLLYNQQLPILVGPEENDLASQVVSDIKALNVLNVLPGYAAPTISRTETSGAWLRLAPSAWHMGCAIGKYAVYIEQPTCNSMIAQDDYDASLASVFAAALNTFGGTAKPSVTVDPTATTYAPQIDRAFGQSADGTALLAFPTTAARIITEWTVAGRPGTWFLSPMLRNQALLDNIPYGSLDGFWGVSPSVSLREECDVAEDADNSVNQVSCATDNATRFADHFASRWEGTRPFAAASFYYDAVVLLAMGMQYAMATRGEIPAAQQLQQIILSLNAPGKEIARWDTLPESMTALAEGTAARYVGAGAAYEFDRFGSAEYSVFDIWGVDQHAFSSRGAFYSICPLIK